MRYRHEGNVHKDFHLATQTTISYILGRYGEAFLEELFRRTAQKVYRDIHESLAAGDFEPLLEHWSYYYEREGGEFEVSRNEDGVDFIVHRCPAVRHVIERQGTVEKSFTLQFEFLCRGFSEATPFVIAYRPTGEGSYIFEIRTRGSGS